MDAGYFYKKLSNGAKFNLKVKTKSSNHKIKVATKGDTSSVKNSVIETVKPNRKKLKAKSLQHQANLKQEKLNEFRKKNRIFVSGSDIPDPVSNFEDLHSLYGISKTLSNNAKEMGYEFLTPVQMQAIPVMLENRELLACAPTGSGKTAAFLLPILHSLKERKRTGIRAVIVAPTRELAKQIQRECQKLSEGTGLSSFVIKKANANKPISKKQDILVTTPNRLVFLLNQEPPLVSLSTVKWLIIDESDKLFETGKQGFRDQLAVIYKSCNGPGVRRAMFSATFASEVEAWCKLNMDNVVTISVGARNSAVNIIKQNLIFVGSEAGKLVAFRDLIKKGIRPPVLVFVQSKDRAKELFGELIYDGINVDVIHAERTQTQRDNVVKSFRAGKIWVLICTELMGRGIDFRGVNLVVNYDFPPSAVSYIHRIGRTGRAGRPGEAVTFFTEDDVTNLRTIAQIMKDSGCEVPEYMMALKKTSRKDKKHLAKQAPKRKSISTVPKDKFKRKRATNETKTKLKDE